MQSHDYVPGVSGWKIDPTTGAFELCSNQLTVSGFDPRATYCQKPQAEADEVFVVVDGKMYINRAAIDHSLVTNIRITESATSGVEQIRDVLRAELKPGGMLHIATRNR
ncbi:hypothetical protein [Pseudomonas sp. CMR5c]|uniref:hypothetical protein n=1 Tax=Pseudomonas sp. CMR5c TaxID=658630 RepID=UPI00069CCDC6|nr:hypothetical protein [Pseudomonas sp. CMR5c]AZC19557.1 hypothetical protein C4K40_4176 [Pseudomonas sp. CMR5c]